MRSSISHLYDGEKREERNEEIDEEEQNEVKSRLACTKKQ
jgi:hypothetical protein